MIWLPCSRCQAVVSSNPAQMSGWGDVILLLSDQDHCNGQRRLQQGRAGTRLYSAVCWTTGHLGDNSPCTIHPWQPGTSGPRLRSRRLPETRSSDRRPRVWRGCGRVPLVRCGDCVLADRWPEAGSSAVVRPQLQYSSCQPSTSDQTQWHWGAGTPTMMISQFWSLCRACPALDVDKVSATHGSWILPHQPCAAQWDNNAASCSHFLFCMCSTLWGCFHFVWQSSIIYRSATLLRLLLPFQWRSGSASESFFLDVSIYKGYCHLLVISGWWIFKFASLLHS